MVKYELDPAHTNVGFTAKHLAVSTVHGQFNRWEGQFEGPDDSLTGVRGTLKVEVASLSTRNDQRDTHLRSADFFDAEKYPYITFTGSVPFAGHQIKLAIDAEIVVKAAEAAAA